MASLGLLSFLEDDGRRLGARHLQVVTRANRLGSAPGQTFEHRTNEIAIDGLSRQEREDAFGTATVVEHNAAGHLEVASVGDRCALPLSERIVRAGAAGSVDASDQEICLLYTSDAADE